MTRSITVERRRPRGFFGTIFLLAFLAWQGLFAFWMVDYVGYLGGSLTQDSDTYRRAGTVIGGTIGMTFIMLIWGFGSALLGLLTLATRGRKELVTTIEDPPGLRPMPQLLAEPERSRGPLIATDPRDRPRR